MPRMSWFRFGDDCGGFDVSSQAWYFARLVLAANLALYSA